MRTKVFCFLSVADLYVVNRMADTWTVLQSVAIVTIFVCGFLGGVLAKVSQRHAFTTQILNLAAGGGKSTI